MKIWQFTAKITISQDISIRYTLKYHNVSKEAGWICPTSYSSSATTCVFRVTIKQIRVSCIFQKWMRRQYGGPV